MKKIITIITIILCSNLNAESLFIVGPYAGFNNNVQNGENRQETEETGLIYGLYAQFINPNYFQINNFLYHAPDINETSVIGNHINADFYPYSFPIGSIAIGGGLEYVSMDISQDDFSVKQTIIIPYARMGQNFVFGKSTSLCLFPWVGFGKQFTDGDGTVRIIQEGAPELSQDFKVETDDNIILYGANLRFKFEHYFDVVFKYSINHNMETKHNYKKTTVMLNAYLHKHAGVSYRFMYNEHSYGEDLTNLVGIFYKY
ncbi:MAG: hypothetical protein PF637_11135 [Spirochaetes bacterium]|nr:hypothetical protein [Spirochaetota bacterium]